MKHPPLVLAFTLAILGSKAMAAQEVGLPPPTRLSNGDHRGTGVPTSYPGLSAAVTYDLQGRKLDITWFREFGLAYPQKSFQSEALDFWPTEACEAGSNKLCVAGKNSKGQTLVHLWEFSATEMLDPSTIHPKTGETIYPDTYVPVVQKGPLYEGDVAGKRLVRTMFHNHGAPGTVFVLFDDSRDLYRLDLSTTALTLVLSSSAEPRLLHDYRDHFASNHLDRGFLYLLNLDSNEEGRPETLILVDPLRNGQLDSAATLFPTYDEWCTLFADQTRFHEVH